MKIDLIYPDVSSFHGLPYHPGLASIAAVLKANGHDVAVSYFDSVKKMDDIFRRVLFRKPDVVGFTSVETQFRYARTLAKLIKEKHQCVIVCGGVYTTLFPEVAAEKYGPFDMVFMGEGEYAFAEFISKLEKGEDWRDIANIAYYNPISNKLTKNCLRPLERDLDKFPLPATELFPYQEIIDRENVAMFHFSRGCPYHCAFCSNEAIGKAYGLPSNPVRYRSVESVISEIEMILSKYRVNDDTLLCFQDDLFISNKKWIAEFCDVYKKTVNRPFWCTGRSNYLNDEICAAIKEAGCAMLMMSVESGNDYIRNEIMKRNISRKALIESFDMCYRYGINTLVSCIVGLPFETPDMIEDSIKTVAGLKSVASYGINTFYPYKGTALRALCEESGYLPGDRLEDGDFVERADSVLKLPTLTKRQIRYYCDNWVTLIMRHKRFREKCRYRILGAWSMLRKTSFGRFINRILNSSCAGKSFKRCVARYVSNRH